MSRKITHFETHDVRFPTSLTGDGSDAMNTTCDYSSAYISIFTDGELPLVGHGMTFTIGRGNDIVCQAIIALANKLIGRDPEDLFKSMGKAWDWLSSDSQLRWIGPEKGVIHLAAAAVNNALWDMFARAREKPLWKLVVDMTPEEFVEATAFRYITDAITREEAVALLKAREAGKKDRETTVKELG